MSEEVSTIEAVVAQPEAEQTQAASPETPTAGEQDVQKQARTFTQDELDSIVQREKAKAEAKAERKAARAYRDGLERQPQQPVQHHASDGMPKRDQFVTDEAWLDARDGYRDAQREAKQAQERQHHEHVMLTDKTEKMYKEAEKLQGFDREAFDDLQLTPHIARALIESDMAPQLMHHLTTNPDEVERIAAFSPARQGVELGKLEAKLSAAPVKTSKAPPPISPIGGAKANTGDLSKASMDDYIAMRKKQGAAWSR